MTLKGVALTTTNVVTAVVAIISLVLSVSAYISTENEKRVLDRPYLSIVDRYKLLNASTSSSSSMNFNVLLKNTGSLPARFTADLDGWHCTGTKTQADSDYILPSQEMEIGYDLPFGCKEPRTPVEDICRHFERLQLNVRYALPNDANHVYSTTLKTKLIPATEEALNLSATSSKFSMFIYRCGGEENQGRMVPVWYVEKMD